MTSPDWIAAEFSFTVLRIWLMHAAEAVKVETHPATAQTLPEILTRLPQIPIVMADLTGELGQGETAPVPRDAKLQTQTINLGV